LKNDLESLLGNFKSYFGKTELDYVFADETMFTRVQRPNEKARDYISQMQKLAKRVPHFQDEILHWMILCGLRPWSKPASSRKKATSRLPQIGVREGGRIGGSRSVSDATKLNRRKRCIRRTGREKVQLSTKMAKMSVAMVQPRSPTPERRQQRVSFQEP